ncbi:SAV_915 family protein [Streptomyces sp. NPDC055210]
MSAIGHPEDSDPPARVPAGLLFVPVRSGPVGCTTRFFRTPLGGRTAVGFASAAKLTATLGTDQACVRLSEPALRALGAPLGITALTVDPQFSALPAAPVASPALVRAGEYRRSWHVWQPRHIGARRVTGTTAVITYLYLLIG